MVVTPEQSERSSNADTATTDVLLKVSDVDFSYGQLQVLFGISLDVQRGEALALLDWLADASGASGGLSRPG